MDKASRSMTVCSRCIRRAAGRRHLSYTARRHDAEGQPQSSTNDQPPPTTDDTAKVVAKGGRHRQRRRVLISQLGENSISFDQMPYQCFQEARKVLQEDRKEKLAELEARRARIEKLRAQETAPQDERLREMKLRSMRKALEELKIHADINDPLVKKKFEDGHGDMSKPIYRFLADRKWREYKRKIVMQRIEQMNVVPDVLPEIDPVLSTEMSFGGRKVNHGEILNSAVTERAPNINIQPYDQGNRLVTIAVINPDVPHVAKDSFTSRCHFLACNILVSPTTTHINLWNLDEEKQILLPWLAPYAQKGLGYQRLAVCIMEQPARDNTVQSSENTTRSELFNAAAIREQKGKDTRREGLTARALITRHRLQPVAIDLFRTQHDENTAAVMNRANITGADVAFKRKRIEPLPYKRMSTARYR